MRKGLSTILVVCLTVTIMLVLGIGLYYFYLIPQLKSNTASSEKNLQDSSQSKNVAMEPQIIYFETISETDTDERSWPTVNIYQTRGDNDRELLASVGKEGEYPNSFKLSPDKTKLFISLEKKLQVLDLSSKELTDFFVPAYQIGGFIFSPDGEELLVWDEPYVWTDDNPKYAIHRFNLANGTDTVIKEGTLSQEQYNLSPYAWRSDNKVALFEPGGEVVRFWSYDLATNDITEASLEIGSDWMANNDGKRIIKSSSYLDDICDDYMGVATKAYTVFDNITGTNFGTVSYEDRFLSAVAISPDENELLYYTTMPVTDKNLCNSQATRSYYVYNISNSVSTPVTDYISKLKEWQADNIGAELQTSDNGEVNSILIGDKIIATSNKSLFIIAQYWK